MFLSLGNLSHFIFSPKYTPFLPIPSPIQLHNPCKQLCIRSLFLHMHVITNISSENCGLFLQKQVYIIAHVFSLIKQYTVEISPHQLIDI